MRVLMMLWNGYKRAMTGFKWRWVSLFSLLSIAVPVWADVPAYPPQNVPSMQRLAAAPNGQLLTGYNSVNGNWSYDMNSGVAKVDRFQNVNRGAGGLVGTKTNPVNLYDNYGNIARGQIQTQTAMPVNSRIAQGLGSIYVLQIANQHLTNLKAQGVSEMYSRGFENGDWGMVADATARLFDWTGFGGNVRDSIWGNPDMQQIQQQLHQQALQQAQQQFQNYQAVQQPQQIDPKLYAQYSRVVINQDHPANQIRTSQTVMVKTPGQTGNSFYGWYHRNEKGQAFTIKIGEQTFDYSYPAGNVYVSFNVYPATAQDIRDYNLSNAPQLSEIVPKEAEVARLLEQILNDNNRNHTELINALWGAGVIGPGNTQSMVMGGPADNTFLTQPFTPEGSNQAQQTQFIVNNNGSITQNTIQRPDLVANSSQAPTRAEVATQHQQGQQDTRPQKEGSTSEKPDICAQNPNSLMCAPMGNTDYQDLVLPQQNINIALSPLHIFNTDAACPAPTSFSIAGTQQRMSYEPMCDTARKARPFIIMMAMTAAFLMVFSALNRR
nr:MAG TPA: attachment protein [Inoviridae sp.]